jgi:RNA polymerase sigma factor (sigma-70 family)
MYSIAVRRVGPKHAEDVVHDSFIATIEALRYRGLRHSGAVFNLARIILSRTMLRLSRDAVRRERVLMSGADGAEWEIADVRPDPYQSLHQRERVSAMRIALMQLDSRQREILERIYLREEPQEEICEAMGLTEAQYRLLKFRSKQRLATIAAKKTPSSTLARKARACA